MRNSVLLYTLVLAAVPVLAPAQSWISAAPTASTYYGGSLFNFRNDTTDTLQLTGLFDLHLSGAGGLTRNYEVYTKNSALVGTEMSATPWTRLGVANVASTNPQPNYTTIDVGNTFNVAPGQTIGIGIFFTSVGLENDPNAGGFVGYTNGANTYTDGSVTLSTGITKGYDGTYVGNNPQALFGVAQTFPNRSFSGRVQYTTVSSVPEPFSMATIAVGLAGLAIRRRKRA